MNQPSFETLSLSPQEAENFTDCWQDLADRALEPNPFFEPGFVLPLNEALKPDSLRIVALADRNSGNWLIAAPFVRRRPGLLIAGAVGWATEFGPLGVPLIAPDLPSQTATLFLDAVSKGLGSKNIAFPYLPLKGPAADLLTQSEQWHGQISGATTRAAHHGGHTGQEEFKGFRRSKRHKELGRQLRRLAEQGPMEFRSISGTEASAALEAFQVLEAAGWKGRKGTALANTPAIKTFANTMFKEFAARDQVRIDCLTSGGHPIAMLVLLRAASQVFSWKIAFDENLARFSPGAQITFHALKTNLADKTLTLADSLAVPGHSMIEPIWRGKRSFGTVLCSRSAWLPSLWATDLSALTTIKTAAKKALRRP